MNELTLEEIEIILMYLGKVSTYPMQPNHEKKFLALLTKLESLKSFQQSRAMDLACAECGETFEAHKYNNCGHEFISPPNQ